MENETQLGGKMEVGDDRKGVTRGRGAGSRRESRAKRDLIVGIGGYEGDDEGHDGFGPASSGASGKLANPSAA